MKERCLVLVLLIVRVRTTDPQFYTVFKSNDGKYPCYRQVRDRLEICLIERKVRLAGDCRHEPRTNASDRLC